MQRPLGIHRWMVSQHQIDACPSSRRRPTPERRRPEPHGPGSLCAPEQSGTLPSHRIHHLPGQGAPITFMQEGAVQIELCVIRRINKKTPSVCRRGRPVSTVFVCVRARRFRPLPDASRRSMVELIRATATPAVRSDWPAQGWSTPPASTPAPASICSSPPQSPRRGSHSHLR